MQGDNIAEHRDWLAAEVLSSKSQLALDLSTLKDSVIVYGVGHDGLQNC